MFITDAAQNSMLRKYDLFLPVFHIVRSHRLPLPPPSSLAPTSRNKGKLVWWEAMFRQTKHAYTWAFYSLIRWPLDGDTAGSGCVFVCVIYPPSAEIQPIIINLIGCLVRPLIIASVLARELLENYLSSLTFFKISLTAKVKAER